MFLFKFSYFGLNRRIPSICYCLSVNSLIVLSFYYNLKSSLLSPFWVTVVRKQKWSVRIRTDKKHDRPKITKTSKILRRRDLHDSLYVYYGLGGLLR